jgi:hypothetical protein
MRVTHKHPAFAYPLALRQGKYGADFIVVETEEVLTVYILIDTNGRVTDESRGIDSTRSVKSFGPERR